MVTELEQLEEFLNEDDDVIDVDRLVVDFSDEDDDVIDVDQLVV